LKPVAPIMKRLRSSWCFSFRVRSAIPVPLGPKIKIVSPTWDAKRTHATWKGGRWATVVKYFALVSRKAKNTTATQISAMAVKRLSTRVRRARISEPRTGCVETDIRPSRERDSEAVQAKIKRPQRRGRGQGRTRSDKEAECKSDRKDAPAGPGPGGPPLSGFF
jgi:hypothetical protein